MIYILMMLLSMLIAWLACEFSPEPERRLIFRIHGLNIKTDPVAFRLLAVVSALPLTILSAFRFEIGTDYLYTYKPLFLNILNGSSTFMQPKTERGFFLLIKFIQLFTDNPQWIFIITSILFLGLIYYYIYEYSLDVPLSIFILVGTTLYFCSYNMVRQMLAFAIAFYAFRFIPRRKFIIYMLLIMLAGSFHYAALICLPLYFVLDRHWDPRLIVLLACVMFYLTPKFLSWLVTMDTLQSNFDPVEKLIQYLYNDIFPVLTVYPTRLLHAICLSLGIFSLWSDNRQYEDTESIRFTIALNLQYITVICAVMSFYFPFILRYVWSFSIGLLILLPFCIQRESIKWKQIVLTIFIVLLLSGYCYQTTVNLNWHEVLPYRWCFGK